MGKTENIRYLQKLPNGPLSEGSKISIVGRVTSPATEFAIDLMKGAEGEIIMLHFNPRFHENVVILNTYDCGGWQQEERHDACPVLPFVPGLSFTLEIRCASDHFGILVNKQNFVEYAYRLPVEEVTYIRAVENVEILRLERSS